MRRSFTLFMPVLVLALIAPGARAATTKSISGASPFTSTCSGFSNSYGAEVETNIAVNPADPNNIVAAWQQDRIGDGGAQGIATAVTKDGGATWTKVVPPGLSRCSGGPHARATDPWLAWGGNGVLYLASLPMEPFGVAVSRSTDGGLTWGAPVYVTRDAAVIEADKETITADPNDPNRAYAVWVEVAGALVTFQSTTVDGGLTWSPPVPIHAPLASLGGQGNEIAVLPSGALVDIYTETMLTGYRVMAKVAAPGGLVWGPPVPIGTITSSQGPSSPVAVRAGAFIPSVDANANGVYVTWANGNNVVLASSPNGVVWTTQTVKTSTTAVFTPTVAAGSGGRLAITFYDFRNDTPGGEASTDLWALTSSNASPWSEQHLLGSFDLKRAPYSPGRGYFLGDYQGLVATPTGFVGSNAIGIPASSGPFTDVYFSKF